MWRPTTLQIVTVNETCKVRLVTFAWICDLYLQLAVSSPSAHQLSDTIPGSIFLLSRGTFSCPANLLPWRSSSSGIYKKSHRRAASSENVPGLERLLKAWALTEFPQGLTSISGPQGPLDPYEPLLPLLIGPGVGLWRECYLRGALHAQVGEAC